MEIYKLKNLRHAARPKLIIRWHECYINYRRCMENLIHLIINISQNKALNVEQTSFSFLDVWFVLHGVLCVCGHSSGYCFVGKQHLNYKLLSNDTEFMAATSWGKRNLFPRLEDWMNFQYKLYKSTSPLKFMLSNNEFGLTIEEQTTISVIEETRIEFSKLESIYIIINAIPSHNSFRPLDWWNNWSVR